MIIRVFDGNLSETRLEAFQKYKERKLNSIRNNYETDQKFIQNEPENPEKYE